MKTMFLLACTSWGALLATGTQAQAQGTERAPSPAAAPAAADSTDVRDIIVTARRRAENLQDVPISITAVSGATLVSRGVRDALDLQYQTPSLTVTTNGASRTSVSYSIRGQRTNEAQLLTDPPVGTYFAEVVMPRTYGFGTAFYDIENIQVLKGVQGTLFGRNMTGGAVLVEPAHPDLSGFHVAGTGQYGNLDLKDVSGMINIPVVSDVLAIRAAGKIRSRDGFTTDVSNGRKYDDQRYKAFRVGMELKLGRLTNYTVFDYVREREHGTALKLIGFAFADPINGKPTAIAQQAGAAPFFPVAAGAPVQDLGTIFARDVALDKYRVNFGGVGTTILDGTPGLPYNHIKNYGVTNKTTLAVGDLTFKNIFGYRRINYVNHTDYDGSEAAMILPVQLSNTRDTSEEFQIQGTPFGSRLQLTVGAYYFRESGQDGSYQSTFPQLTAIGFASNIRPLASYFLTQPATFYQQSAVNSGVARSYAFYGAGTFAITDELKFSGGIRYNNDRRSATVNPFYPNFTIPGQGTGFCLYNGFSTFSLANCAHSASLNNDAVTWDATLQYEPSPEITAYLSTRRGYRAGGFNLRADSDTTFAPFQPETVQEYEAGLKNRIDLGGGTRLNTSAAIYYQNYRNVQRQNSVVIGSSIATVIRNTAAQHNYGGEFEANLFMASGFGANFFYSYIKNKVVSGDNGSFVMQGVPKHQLGGGLSYNHRIEGAGSVAANINATYRSKTPLDEFDVILDQKGYTLVNARIGLSDITGTGIGVAVFANNLTNKYYKIGGISLLSGGQVSAGAGFSAASFGEPRTYGIEISFKF